MALKDALDGGKFAVTTEVGPLKGTDTTEIFEVAELLNGKVDGVNVTDQQSAVMRLGSLATCALLVKKGLDPIFQMTCRDRNRI
ncbi:MAG: methylenetetrahydrofolate reductase, partial [Deltaproteobacteria bacterium]|nr:methylenetetrahydrofolate reductase [Deltaproteobacteria bacterium]